MPVESDYWWDGRIQHTSEAMLMIEVPVTHTTPGVLKWIDETAQ